MPTTIPVHLSASTITTTEGFSHHVGQHELLDGGSAVVLLAPRTSSLALQFVPDEGEPVTYEVPLRALAMAVMEGRGVRARGDSLVSVVVRSDHEDLAGFLDSLGLGGTRYADIFSTAWCGYWACGIDWDKARGWLVWEDDECWEAPEAEIDRAIIVCEGLGDTRREFADNCMEDIASDRGMTLDEYKRDVCDLGLDDNWLIETMQNHRDLDLLRGPSHLAATRAWKAGEELPSGYFALDRDTALSAFAHGVKRHGVEGAFGADANELDAMIQLAGLGEVRYG